MNICFFGSYVHDNLTNRLYDLLSQKNVKIIEIHKNTNSLFQLIIAYFILPVRHFGKTYDIMIIPRRGILTLPLAKILTKKPIIHFQYVPIYDSFINDRQKFKKTSLIAKLIKFIEKTSCKWSDITVLDSFEACKFVSGLYNLPLSKFTRFFWGTDEEQFIPLPIKKREKTFEVFFMGTYIPFHGVDVIVESAKILQNNKDIKFTMCGDGQTRKHNQKLSEKYNLDNIRFLGFVNFSTVKEKLRNADVCLGVLGNSERRTNTAPNKIFEALASQKPLITRETPAMYELLLKNNENCILVPGGDANALSEAILQLKNNPDLSRTIAINGFKTYKKITEYSWDNFWKNIIVPLSKKPSK